MRYEVNLEVMIYPTVIVEAESADEALSLAQYLSIDFDAALSAKRSDGERESIAELLDYSYDILTENANVEECTDFNEID
jgi:hypothetical protein